MDDIIFQEACYGFCDRYTELHMQGSFFQIESFEKNNLQLNYHSQSKKNKYDFANFLTKKSCSTETLVTYLN